MTPELRSRIAHRTRASRLRSDLTGLTVLTGLVATAGFGWLAAETYAGTPQTSKTATTTDRSTVATPTPTHESSTSNGSTSNGSSSSSSSGSSSSGGSVSGNSGVSRSSGRGHITSGSS